MDSYCCVGGCLFFFFFNNLREKGSVALTKQSGTECFKSSCGSPVETHWLKSYLNYRKIYSNGTLHLPASWELYSCHVFYRWFCLSSCVVPSYFQWIVEFGVSQTKQALSTEQSGSRCLSGISPEKATSVNDCLGSPGRAQSFSW